MSFGVRWSKLVLVGGDFFCVDKNKIKQSHGALIMTNQGRRRKKKIQQSEKMKSQVNERLHDKQQQHFIKAAATQIWFQTELIFLPLMLSKLSTSKYVYFPLNLSWGGLCCCFKLMLSSATNVLKMIKQRKGRGRLRTLNVWLKSGRFCAFWLNK